MKVITQVTFACSSCGSKDLVVLGAVLCEEHQAYMIFACTEESCEEQYVPIKIDSIIINLYEGIKTSEAN